MWLALVWFVAGCGSAADPGVLLQADRAFCAEVATGGSQAWAGWFQEDGAVVHPGVGEIRGREDIAAAVAFLDQPGVSLTWEPDRADIAASGDLGWTTGSYQLVQADPVLGETGRSQGRYVSIWRLQSDGTWKVAMDLGNTTEAPPP